MTRIVSSDDELHVGISLPRQTARNIFQWAKDQPWPEGSKLQEPKDFHITLLYSPVGHELKNSWWINHLDKAVVNIVGFDNFPATEQDGFAYVLLIDSPDILMKADELQSRAKEFGLPITDFPGGYKPHITVAYGPVKATGIKAPYFEFDVGPSEVSPRRIASRISQEDYRGLHEAPGPDSGWPITDMNAGLGNADFYTHPHYYMFNDPQYDRESLAGILPAYNNPDASIAIHRAGPSNQINPGDWVTPSHAYAKHHGMHPDDPSQDMKVWSARVPASTLYWNGDDLNEYGYHGPAIQGQKFYRTRSNPELRPANEIQSRVAYNPDEVQVLDQLSIANIAHNLHYKFEQDPNTDIVTYAKKLLNLIGYPQDDITAQAALQSWQQIYPKDKPPDQEKFGHVHNELCYPLTHVGTEPKPIKVKQPDELEGWDEKSTVPSEVNNPEDRIPEFGKKPPDKQDVQFSNDWNYKDSKKSPSKTG